MTRLRFAFALPLAAALSLTAAAGCDTEAFCFRDCVGNGFGTGGGTGANGGSGGLNLDGGGANGGIVFIDGGGTGGSGGSGDCVATGDEICDGIDNNCDGQIDEGYDFGDARTCGTCDTNCLTDFVTAATCTPPAVPGQPGTCTITQCDPPHYDVDGDPTNGCEYICNTNGTATLDDGNCGADDDCDGQIDEDVQTCSDPQNCGACGNSCELTGVNATFRCVSTAASGEACTRTNTHCEVATCLAGYVDANGDWRDGCEYQCTPTGPEVCDGIDNDCDRLIDDADPSLETDQPTIGAACHGGELGACATRDGISKCVSGGLRCCDPASNDESGTNPNFPATGLRNSLCDSNSGVQVLRPGELPDTCNNQDDDCDGITDGTLTGASGVTCTTNANCDPSEECKARSGATGKVCAKPASDTGAWCGSDVGNCRHGTLKCNAGTLGCAGAQVGGTEACNGQDDNCDGVVDGTVSNGSEPTCTVTGDCGANQECVGVGVDPAGVNDAKRVCVPTCTTDTDCGGVRVCAPSSLTARRLCVIPPGDTSGPCDVPRPPPAGTVSACQAGEWSCQGGRPMCVGAVLPPSPSPADTCGVDQNCDGLVTYAHDPSDIHNCGTCGNDCLAGKPVFAHWACENPGAGYQCVFKGCQPGFIACNAADPQACETACTPTAGGVELCNTIDDDCDCQVDEASDLTVPTSQQACGVAAAATSAGCRGRAAGGTVDIACVGGAWQCTFTSAGYCQGTPPDYCAVADGCDGLDNNCDGNVDEAYQALASRALGDVCHSDDGLPQNQKHGRCQRTGEYVCNATHDGTVCDVAGNPDLTQRLATETCNGLDDDCDGAVDEYAGQTGSGDGVYVKPAVVNLGNSVWVFAYEASRPNATAADPGSGDGYFDSAPAGRTRDSTIACSVAGKMPWVNVSPYEVEESCQAVGGRVCRFTDWNRACTVAAANCTWGYAPTAACKTAANYTTGPFCNVGPFDYDAATAGDQNGLLPTASSRLSRCYADWSGVSGNPAGWGAFDITGNAREIGEACQKNRAVCGRGSGTAATIQANCNADCCARANTNAGGPATATSYTCGAIMGTRRLSGQPCNAAAQCCNSDTNCTANGLCTAGICRNTGATTGCRVRGMWGCTTAANDCCDGAPCVPDPNYAGVNVCGEPDTLPYMLYTLAGGGYETIDAAGATCSYDFFKVERDFQLYDTGFRCCFDSNPSP